MEIITVNISGIQFYHNAVWLFENCGYRWRVIITKGPDIYYSYVSRASRRIQEDILENSESYLVDEVAAPCTYAFLRKEDALLFKLSCC